MKGRRTFAVLVCLAAVSAAIVGESERVVNAVLLVAKFLVVGLPQRLELFGVLQFEVRGKCDGAILEVFDYGSLTLGCGSFSICGQILLVLFIFFCSTCAHFVLRLTSSHPKVWLFLAT